MEPQDQTLPDEAIAALKSGNNIEAIKIIREVTGLGLKESKDAADAYLAGNPQRAGNSSDIGIPTEAIGLLETGNLIGAIHAVRAKTGLGLKDSKQAVEAYLEDNPPIKELFKSANSRKSNNIVIKAVISLAVTAVIILLLKFLRVIA